jgi:ketosteroid isomerase-like protein
MTNAKSEASIRTLIEDRAEGVRTGDVDRMMADVADDIVTFDVVEPLCRQGRPSARERAAEWVASYEGSIGWECTDVHVTADGDVAFSQALNRVSGKLKSGAEIDMWFRTTLGLRRISGRWLIVHEHSSAPFDPKTGQASLGLKP